MQTTQIDKIKYKFARVHFFSATYESEWVFAAWWLQSKWAQNYDYMDQ